MTEQELQAIEQAWTHNQPYATAVADITRLIARIREQQMEIAELHRANNDELLNDMYDDANAEAVAGCYRGMSEWGM